MGTITYGRSCLCQGEVVVIVKPASFFDAFVAPTSPQKSAGRFDDAVFECELNPLPGCGIHTNPGRIGIIATSAIEEQIIVAIYPSEGRFRKHGHIAANIII